MKLMVQRKRKRGGKKLSVALIDDDKKVNAYARNESMKSHVHRITVIALWGALLSLPALYCLWLWTSWHELAEREKVLTTGLGSMVSFLIGKAKFKLGDDSN
jgi:hypothetical protein